MLRVWRLMVRGLWFDDLGLFDLGFLLATCASKHLKSDFSLLQQPGHKKFKLSKIELIYKAKECKVPLFTTVSKIFERDTSRDSCVHCLLSKDTIQANNTK